MIIIKRIMKNIAVILAGGVGSRMNSKTPKQFIKINGKEMILYSLKTFSLCKKINNIIIVSHPKYISKVNSLIKNSKTDKVISIVPGGKSRQESVLNGLEEAKRLFGDCNVLVHDSARPMVTERIILDNIKALESNDCCTTALPTTDSIYEVKKGKVIAGLDRNNIYLAQTPQCGKLNILYSAYKDAKKEFTDEASLLSSIGLKPVIVLGDICNKKVTTKEDLKDL